MGIAVKDLLATEYFNDFRVIAGHNGVSREIQGITLLEAPDGLKWARGKEMILSSGYVISINSDIIQKSFEEGNIQGISALVIKEQRYIDKIPTEIIKLFDEHEIPLIIMPFFLPWMEVINQVNIIVMNRIMRRFTINNLDKHIMHNEPYKYQKIKRILKAVEDEVDFPAAVFDMTEDKKFFSSKSFNELSLKYGISDNDFWEADTLVSRSTLCDYIGMMRFRLYNNEAPDEPRISWIHVPIIVNNTLASHFVILESRDFIDNYDEYSIRIAFLMLQGLYEQLNFAQNAGSVGFENLIKLALDYDLEDKSKLIYQANAQGISLSAFRYCIRFLIKCKDGNVSSIRKSFYDVFPKCMISKNSKIAFISENEGFILVESKQNAQTDKEETYELIKQLSDRLKLYSNELESYFAVDRTPINITELGNSSNRCARVLKMGKILSNNENIWDYETFGPLCWLDIPNNELESLLSKYKKLLENEKNVLLLKTLKCYLENNMVFNATAEKMYVHINTIRKRLIQIDDIIDVNLNNPIERMKLSIILNYLGL